MFETENVLSTEYLEEIRHGTDKLITSNVLVTLAESYQGYFNNRLIFLLFLQSYFSLKIFQEIFNAFPDNIFVLELIKLTTNKSLSGSS